MQKQKDHMNTPLDTIVTRIPPPCREQFLDVQHTMFQARGINDAGFSRLHDGYEIVRPKDYFRWNLILFTTAGSGMYDDGEREGELRPGDIMLVRARREIAYRSVGKWDIIWFHLQALDPHGFMSDCPATGVRVQRAIHLDQLRAAVRWYLRETMASFSDPQSLWGPYAEILCTCLDRELHQNNSDPRLKHRRELLNTLWQEVDANISYPWSQAELARRLSMSPAHFVRTVQELEGTTPMRRVADLRFRRAAKLLTDTDYTLDHVAELVGYNSPFSFSRAFHRMTGKSPHMYRRIHRETD